MRHIDASPWLDPPQFRARLEGADAIVAHAGMGTILSALELGKPLLVMPRLARLAETRSDHQIATAREFAARGWLLAAEDETQLPEAAGTRRLHPVGTDRRTGVGGTSRMPAVLHGPGRVGTFVSRRGIG